MRLRFMVAANSGIADHNGNLPFFTSSRVSEIDSLLEMPLFSERLAYPLVGSRRPRLWWSSHLRREPTSRSRVQFLVIWHPFTLSQASCFFSRAAGLPFSVWYASRNTQNYSGCTSSGSLSSIHFPIIII